MKLGDPLSRRELEIAKLLAAGKSSKEIAEALFISNRTVHWHANSIYKKLGVKSKTFLSILLRENGVLTVKDLH